MTTLSVTSLAINRGGRAILDQVSLDARGGAFVAVIGANGAGKSTLLAALAGLLAPDSGSVKLDGRDLSRIARRELARRRGYLPQTPRCEWPISVERLIALGLTPVLPAFGGLPQALAARVDDAVRAFDLEGHKEQAATTLSGGELARAMLARALVGDPEILIVDEPVSGLDPRHALDAMTRLARLAAAGKLVIASVHDLTLAARHASHILALKDGRVAAHGPTASTLAASLVRDVFDVGARVSGEGARALVDFTPD